MATTTSTTNVAKGYDEIYVPNTAAQVAPKKMLGQEDFLKLLTTQMQNQDPTNPVDNTKMIADMANFSSLQAMTDLNTKVETMLTSMKQTQAIQATALVGKTIVDTGTTVTLKAGEAPVAQLNAVKDMTDVKVQIQDSTGRTVRTLTNSGVKTGVTDLEWNGKDDQGNALPDGKYKILAYGVNDVGGQEQIGTLVAFKVTSVDIGTSGAVVNLEDGTTTTLDQVRQIH